jgi:hypothetical protein
VTAQRRCPTCGQLIPRALKPLGFGSSTADRIVQALQDWGGAGCWVPLARLREMVGRTSWFARELTRLMELELVERSGETLTDNRGPGWLGDFMEPYKELWGYAAYDWGYAYRLTTAGINAVRRGPGR